MSRFSEGDLSVTLDATTDDEIGELRRGFNTAVTNIRAMVVQVHEIVRATVAASRHIRASTEPMAHGAQQQIEQAAQVASAAEQMTSAVADNARHIGVVAEMAQRSGHGCAGGRTRRARHLRQHGHDRLHASARRRRPSRRSARAASRSRRSRA